MYVGIHNVCSVAVRNKVFGTNEWPQYAPDRAILILVQTLGVSLPELAPECVGAFFQDHHLCGAKSRRR